MHGTFGRDHNEVLDAETSDRLSARLRLARRTPGMTLKVVADTAGCSESLLSKVETGKAYPSLPMLNRLVQALGIDMGWVFDRREGPEPVIARAGQRSIVLMAAVGHPISVEMVIPDHGKHALQCNIFHIEAGTSSGEQQHTGEETGILLDGRLELLIDGRPHHLSAGDAFAFRSDQAHSFRNNGATRASIFWVNTPPKI